MLTDELEIIVTRIETQYRHLVNPLHDLSALLLRDTLNVWGAGTFPPRQLRLLCVDAPGIGGRGGSALPDHGIRCTQARGSRCPPRRLRWVRAHSRKRGHWLDEQPCWCLGTTQNRRRLRGGTFPSPTFGQRVFSQGVGFSCSHFSTTL